VGLAVAALACYVAERATSLAVWRHWQCDVIGSVASSRMGNASAVVAIERHAEGECTVDERNCPDTLH
jgi:uncharacterized Fe-S center protein